MIAAGVCSGRRVSRNGRQKLPPAAKRSAPAVADEPPCILPCILHLAVRAAFAPLPARSSCVSRQECTARSVCQRFVPWAVHTTHLVPMLPAGLCGAAALRAWAMACVHVSHAACEDEHVAAPNRATCVCFEAGQKAQKCILISASCCRTLGVAFSDALDASPPRATGVMVVRLQRV